MSSLGSLDTALGASPADNKDHTDMALQDPSKSCLFCPHLSSDPSTNLSHMLHAHSFIMPSPDRLLVDIATFLEYLDTVINDFAQCIHCFTQRRDGGAVRSHMRDKGHCRIEVDGVWAGEWREFYHVREGDDDGEDSEDEEMESESGSEASQSGRVPTFVSLDDSTLRLPTGKILSSHRKTRHRPSPDRPSSREPVSIAEPPSTDAANPATQLLTTSLRAQKQSHSLQAALTQLRASDRAALVHLPEAQQRAQLAIQRQQGASATRAQQEVSGNVAQKGNKTLMKYFQPRVRKRHNGLHRESLKT